MTTLDRVKKLCDERGISINDLEEALGYSKNTLYRLKKQNPGSDKLKALADYLHTSTDYLVGRTESMYWEIAENNDVHWEDITDDVAIKVERVLKDLETEGDFTFYGKEMSKNQKEKFIVALKMALELTKL